MAKPPIADLEKTVESLEGLAFFRNFAKLIFNRHVEAVYWKPSEDHQQAKRALLITDKDTQISIANKQLLFFFSLQKFTQQIEDKISFAKGTADGDPFMIRAKVQLSPEKKYTSDGQSTGYRYISVPHVDEAKLGDFRDFHFVHGSICRLYCFADKKQIKVFAIDEKEGDRAINHLLKLVQSKWLLGTAENHAYTGKPPKDSESPELLNIKSHGQELQLSDVHGKMYKIFI
jgi:hypothetical protein